MQGDNEGALVVGVPRAGIRVVQVKGGSVSYDGQGFVQEDRQGSRRVDPVSQARRTRYALRDHLARAPRQVCMIGAGGRGRPA